MSRYRCELENLLMELSDRYGEDDDAVQQVRHELEAVDARRAPSSYKTLRRSRPSAV
jgi:hypothetical protein